MPSVAQDVSTVAEQVRAEFIRKPFGAIWFWNFAVVRAQESGHELIDVYFDTENDRLDLILQPTRRRGPTRTLSIWSPDGLAISPRGLTLQHAERLRMDEQEAWHDQGQYQVRTSHGEAGFHIDGAAALSLDVC